MKKTGRSFAEEQKFLEPVSKCKYRIKPGFVPNMKVRASSRNFICVKLLSKVPGIFYVNDPLKSLVLEELETFCEGSSSSGGFIPAVG